MRYMATAKIIFPMLLTFLSCVGPNKLKNDLRANMYLYVLPLDVEEYIYKDLKERGFEKKELYFQLYHESENYLLIGYAADNFKDEFFGYLKVSESCRKILINDRVYPIVIDSDWILGSKVESIQSIEQRKKNGGSEGVVISRGPYKIDENGISVRFKRDGTIVNK